MQLYLPNRVNRARLESKDQCTFRILCARVGFGAYTFELNNNTSSLVLNCSQPLPPPPVELLLNLIRTPLREILRSIQTASIIIVIIIRSLLLSLSSSDTRLTIVIIIINVIIVIIINNIIVVPPRPN